MRGGIAERGGVRVGHRIIEINGQSVVATPHEKIVHILSNAVGEVGAGWMILHISAPLPLAAYHRPNINTGNEKRINQALLLK